MWFRVDNRLIHGQVIEGWLPYTGAKNLVVANDRLAEDDLSQQIMSLAVSRHVDVLFSHVDMLATTLRDLDDATFVLFENCHDVRRACEAGAHVPELNIGNVHYSKGRRQVNSHVALSDDDVADIRFIVTEQHTLLDFRAVPSEKVKTPDEQLF